MSGEYISVLDPKKSTLVQYNISYIKINNNYGKNVYKRSATWRKEYRQGWIK